MSLFRKVEPSELAMCADGLRVHSASCFLCCPKVSDELMIEFGNPRFSKSFKMNSLVSRFIERIRSLVPTVLRDGCRSQIFSAVVQGNVVFVVNVRGICIYDEAVHENGVSGAFAVVRPNSVEGFCPLVPSCAPLPLNNARVVFGVYDGVLALSEANETAVYSFDLEGLGNLGRLIYSIGMAYAILVVLSFAVMNNPSRTFQFNSSGDDVCELSTPTVAGSLRYFGGFFHVPLYLILGGA